MKKEYYSYARKKRDMYQLEALFDKRSAVGARLKQILVEKNEQTKDELYYMMETLVINYDNRKKC